MITAEEARELSDVRAGYRDALAQVEAEIRDAVNLGEEEAYFKLKANSWIVAHLDEIDAELHRAGFHIKASKSTEAYCYCISWRKR